MIIKAYNKRSSKPVYHYLRCIVKTKNPNYFDKYLPSNIDFKGKHKIVFGWEFCWPCEEDYINVPQKQLEKAIDLANELEKDSNVMRIEIYNYFL